CQHYYSSPYSF
nr:immunoglobulin light chain junction region [Macaca mulatta]MOW08338.1 immunoglobulin light chain junction region [Macaca mulatta]MOW08693.1 immunoglobulin light chain junction region [Macaca mulatta]MOW08759.1 immunoglobulin light chain junction region [Macaca mulatta]MOW09012.1 immunoglobulin light chain junction region [Macaca mulatta]